MDDTATLFRLDIRTLGWDSSGLFRRVVDGQPRLDEYRIMPFDLILLEYPDGFTLPQKDPRADEVGRFLSATKQLRPVPFLRADWLADALRDSTAKPPINRPLAEELKSLVALAEAKAKGAKPLPCGVPPRPFFEMKPAVVPTVNGRIASPPFSAWYSGDIAPDPYGMKFEAVVPLKGNKVASAVELDEPFRFRVSAERDVRFLLLNVLATGEVRVVPTADGNVLRRGEPRLLGPESGSTFMCSSLVTGGVETEHWILIAAPDDVPAPTIIQSLHPDSTTCRDQKLAPVWRFVFDAPLDKFDPNKAARKVVALTVKPKAKRD